MKQKQYINAYVKEIKEGGNIIGAVATTDTPDRDGEILSIEGWELDNFIKNPVLLWGHDSRALPIGKVSNLRRVKNSLLFDAQFAVEENDFAAKVSKLVAGGYLNTFSVGFLPKQKEGDRYTKQELLEISVVNVPANPEAEVSRAYKDFQKTVKSIEKKVETKEVKKEITEVKDKETITEEKEIKEVKEEQPKKKLKKKVQKEEVKEEIKAEVKEVKEVKEIKDIKSPACRQESETQQQCVARKIPEIIREGTEPKQAIAIAFSMCSKPCKSKDESETEEKEEYTCECIKCGYKIKTDKHCKDIKCEKCGGEMRRIERPGPGKELEVKELPKLDIEKEGRIVSEKNRILIRNTVSTLKEASIALEELLKRTEPPTGEPQVGKTSTAGKDPMVLRALKRLDREIERLILTEKGK